MSSKGGSRFEKTFSRKKKATAVATTTTATTTANGGEKKSNNEKKGSEEKQVTKKQPSSQNQKQKQETPPSSSKTVIKIKFNPPKPTNNPEKSNQQASSSAKSKSKPEKVENLNKEKKRKADNQNVGRGKEEKKVKAAAAAKNGKKKEKEKDEEEGLECVFPTARIARIVKSEGSDYKLSSEAIFLINKATEKFIEQFSEDAYGYAVEERKSFVAYKHLAAAVSKGKSFDFLSDFVPEKVTVEKALAERKPPETIPG